MDRLLARLERRFGRFAIPNLPYVLVGGTGIVFVLALMRPEFLAALMLDWDLVKEGQVWRLITYLFIPSSMSPIWVFFILYFMFLFSQALESEWGAFKFNVFYLLGAIGTTVAAILTGPTGGEWLSMSIWFAFCTMFPNYEIYLFFVLRVKVKWLGLLQALFVVFRLATGSMPERFAILAALANYFLFFGGHWIDYLRHRNSMVRQTARRAEMGSAEPLPTDRVCAMCGKKQSEGADIRVCSCEKCGGPRNLCLEHARNH